MLSFFTGQGNVAGKCWSGISRSQGGEGLERVAGDAGKKTSRTDLNAETRKKQTPDPASGTVNTWLFQLLWNTLLPTKTSFKAQPAGARGPIREQTGSDVSHRAGPQCKANCKPEFLPCTVRINSATLLQEQILVHSPALWVTPPNLPTPGSSSSSNFFAYLQTWGCLSCLKNGTSSP